MSFTISLDHDNKLVRYRHSGNLKMEDIGMAWDNFLNMKEFVHEKYNLLSDYRDAVFDMDIDEAYKIISILDSMGSTLDDKKQSIIVKDPYSTAGSILFEQLSRQQLNFKIKIFSTEKAALEWLLK